MIAYYCILKETIMDQLFNVRQAAYILKVHPLTLRRYIKEGKLIAVKAGGNIRIKESDLFAFQRQFVPGESTTATPFIRKKVIEIRVFTDADPFLRMDGRAATVDL